MCNVGYAGGKWFKDADNSKKGRNMNATLAIAKTKEIPNWYVIPSDYNEKGIAFGPLFYQAAYLTAAACNLQTTQEFLDAGLVGTQKKLLPELTIKENF